MPELVEYIRAQQVARAEHGAIVRALLEQGHSIGDINAAFNVVEGRAAPIPVTQAPPVPAAQPPPAVPQPPAPAVPQPAMPAMPAVSPTPPPPVLAVPPSMPPPSAPPPVSALPPQPRVTHVHHLSLALAVIALGIGLVGGTAYAYLNNIGPFAHPPYRQGTFVTGLLESATSIRSATYKVAFALNVGPRDADALPYTPSATGPDLALVAAYTNDATRVRDLSSIFGYLAGALRKSGRYPANLAGLKTSAYGTTAHEVDPAGHPYVYSVTGGGQDYALTAAFETPAAVSAVRAAHGYAATTTMVTGQSVTFTKKSPRYFSVPSAPPKPFFEQMAETVRSLPAEMQVDASLGGTTDFSSAGSDWKFNVAGNGSFGDLSYAIDIDLLKKGALYYARLNKIPSLFLAGINLQKGQWVVIDPTASSTKNTFGLGSMIPTEESSYKKTRQEVAAYLYAVAGIADRDGVIAFKNAPTAETVDGRHLYRYDIRFAKDALTAYGKDVRAELESGKYPDLATYAATAGPASPAPNANLDAEYAYYDANTTLTVWVDEAGRPAIVSYVIRIVPPAEATQLAGKQVNLSMTLSLDGINVPVSISAPEGAIPLETVLKKPAGK